ncbi:MAG TPA: OsmC family protein [Methylomirabilota bacterium]
MTDGVKIDTVRSGSSGVLGRSLNSARHQHFVLDSPSGPNEAITNGEAFLAGISSCGVTLIEKHAHDTGVPLARIDVVIDGIRSNATPNRFQSIHVKFTLRGIDQATARSLVETWQDR